MILSEKIGELCHATGHSRKAADRFLFGLYHVSEKYDRKKKLVPEFPIKELFGKDLYREFEHGL